MTGAIQQSTYQSLFEGKHVLVTGAAGTIGRVLISELLRTDLARLDALDHDENGVFHLEEEFRTDPRFYSFIGDVRDYDKLHHAMTGTHIVLHGAALKHVTICERAPFDAVQTNILGVKNVINASIAANVERVIFMSSDKAVNPTNVMGTTKLMGERLVTAANTMRSPGGTIFSSTRFGNVLGSRGSVLEVFATQIREGEPVTLTSPEMSRFIMSENQAVRLVLESSALARGGEVFVTKMPAVSIQDLAHAVISILAPRYGLSPENIKISITGSRIGEKYYEELVNDEEVRRTIELKHHYVVLPAFSYIYPDAEYTYPDMKSDTIQGVYRSDQETMLAPEELVQFLLDNDLLPDNGDEIG